MADDQNQDQKQVKPAWKTNSTHVSVRSTGGTFWRAGKAWGDDAKILSKADFTPEQAAALLNEPALVVQEVADPAKPAKAA